MHREGSEPPPDRRAIAPMRVSFLLQAVRNLAPVRNVPRVMKFPSFHWRRQSGICPCANVRFRKGRLWRAPRCGNPVD